MVAPLIAAAAPAAIGLGARALAAAGGWSGVAGGIGGSMIPDILDTLLSSKSKEEAAARLKPMRNSKIAELVGRGTSREEASSQVDEEMQGAIQEEMQKGSLPSWASFALSLAGGGAGMQLGKKLGSKLAAPKPADGLKAPFTKTATSPVDSGLSKGELPVIPDLKKDPGIVSPFGPKPARGTPIQDGDLRPSPVEHRTEKTPSNLIAPEFLDDPIESALMAKGELISPFSKRRMSPRDAELSRIMSANPQGY